jgi:hypothetical protein
MDHEKYRELTELLFYDELDEPGRKEIKEHMLTCKECAAAYEELKRLNGLLEKYTPMEATDALLREARESFGSRLRDQRNRTSLWDRFADWAGEALFPRYKIALGTAAAVTVGLLTGYGLFHTPQSGQRLAEAPQEGTLRTAADELRPSMPEGGQIANVKFIDSDANKGEVEFTFDAVMPVHMKGNVNDPKIQQVLAHALLNEQNPGVRLRSVNAIAEEHTGKLDDEIKNVLITAVKSDENPGVRKQALVALQKFSTDPDIKHVLLDILLHDSNSAIRIAAINALASQKDSLHDNDILFVLKQKMNSDDNPYVRLRSRAVLQEIKQ